MSLTVNVYHDIGKLWYVAGAIEMPDKAGVPFGSVPGELGCILTCSLSLWWLEQDSSRDFTNRWGFGPLLADF